MQLEGVDSTDIATILLGLRHDNQGANDEPATQPLATLRNETVETVEAPPIRLHLQDVHPVALEGVIESLRK